MESSSIPLYPKMENYVQLSITLDPKETITFLKQKGDTLKEKEIIAQKNSAQFFLDQVNLNDEKFSPSNNKPMHQSTPQIKRLRMQKNLSE